jgi:hypothetical protein
MAKLEPRCLIGKGHAYSATGYLIPCCWTDPYEIGDGVYEEAAQEIADIFFKEELKLSNVETVYDILQSEAWVNFYNTLVNDEDNAPLICKKMCSSSNLAKLRKDFGKAVKISSSSAEVKVEGSINEQ